LNNVSLENARSGQPMMPEDLTQKVVAWAGEVARHAAQLPSEKARDTYLADRHRELVAGAVAEGTGERDAIALADASVDAARRIMAALLAQRAGAPQRRLN
jgi:hypothetical protein